MKTPVKKTIPSQHLLCPSDQPLMPINHHQFLVAALAVRSKSKQTRGDAGFSNFGRLCTKLRDCGFLAEESQRYDT